MTPAVADLLVKARTCLDWAQRIFAAGVPEPAAREAYLAAFHAAQALIRERRGRVPRTHRGVHALFGQLAIDDSALGPQLGRFLSRAYELKDIADYSTTQRVSSEEAEAAIAEAGRFLAAIERVLGEGPPPG